jgi:hypothetical protein
MNPKGIILLWQAIENFRFQVTTVWNRFQDSVADSLNLTAFAGHYESGQGKRFYNLLENTSILY